MEINSNSEMGILSFGKKAARTKSCLYDSNSSAEARKTDETGQSV
jgi:hypothetical protein